MLSAKLVLCRWVSVNSCWSRAADAGINQGMHCWIVAGILALGLGTLRAAGPEGPTVPLVPPTPVAPPNPLYEYREGTPDGVGKWFLGREIAHYMSHLGAPWLERPEREDEERPSVLVESLRLRPGDVVADVGAGSGYLSWRMAEKVGSVGKVFATDIQPEMLTLLAENMKRRGLTNVVPILGSSTNSGLPAHSVDLLIMVDVYHEFDHPFEMMTSLVASLKPGGRIVFVEYRGEEKWVPIKPLHKMTEAQVRKEMALHPVVWVETLKALLRQHIIIFQRPGEAANKR